MSPPPPGLRTLLHVRVAAAGRLCSAAPSSVSWGGDDDDDDDGASVDPPPQRCKSTNDGGSIDNGPLCVHRYRPVPDTVSQPRDRRFERRRYFYFVDLIENEAQLFKLLEMAPVNCTNVQ